jgi:hypothetical protein
MRHHICLFFPLDSSSRPHKLINLSLYIPNMLRAHQRDRRPHSSHHESPGVIHLVGSSSERGFLVASLQATANR